MLALQHEGRSIREGRTILVNSFVGEFECNEGVENTIQRAQDKNRTLKCHVEVETGIGIDKLEGLMTWLVRWSGELITRYHTGKDKKTAYERMRGKTCNKPIAQFAESVLYMPLDSPNTDDDKICDKLRDGTWLGTNERTEEHYIGTNNGVVKCRTIKRKPEGYQWNAQQLQEMKGSVRQPVPGVKTDRVPIGIMDRTGKPVKQKSYSQSKTEHTAQKPATRLDAAPMALKIFQKDVDKYQPTPGCRACTEVITGRDENRQSIKYNVPHSQDCRARMTELMRQDLDDTARVERAESRQNKFKEELRAAQKEESSDDEHDEAEPSQLSSSNAHSG